MRQHVRRRDLGGRVQGLQVSGEDPHHHQPAAPVDLVAAARGVDRPRQREVGRDVVGVVGLAVGDEPHQRPTLGGQLESQRPPHRQIRLGRGAQLVHDRAPIGHGRANTRSALSSTLA